MFIPALFTITKTRKQPKHLMTEEWIQKIRCVYTKDYYSPIEKNEIMPSAATWTNLEITLPSEVSLRDTHDVTSFMCGI